LSTAAGTILPMTWVVAGNTAFCPFIAADVRVTFPKGYYRDCLLKIHPVAPDVIGGFSGLVRAGFTVLDAVRKRFLADQRGLRAAALDWMPRLMVREFAPFLSANPKEQCNLLFIGVHPTLEFIPTIRQPETFRFRSPRFEPERARQPATFFGIGSGTEVDAFAREASSAAGDRYMQSTFRAFGWTGPAQMLAQRLQMVVSSTPAEKKVSPHFTFGTVWRDGMLIAPDNYTVPGPDGAEREVSVPPLATNYAEFCKYCDREGLAAVASIGAAL
jgi:hypothetical protein